MKRIALIFALILLFTALLCVNASAAEYDLLMGDVIQDGTLTAGDARLVLRASAGLEKLSEEALILADIDFDGAPSAGDARMVLRASVGLEKIAGFYHTHDMQQHTTEGSCVDPSITSDVCKQCGTTVVTGYTAAPGHTWSEYVRINGSHYRDCSVCGEIDSAVCYLEITTNEPATCTKDGLIVKSCVCGLSERTEIKGSHAYSAWAKQSDGSFKSTCANCSDVKRATKDVILSWFNDHVNRLKLQDYAQNISVIRSTLTTSDAYDYSLGLIGAKELLEEALDMEKTKYETPVFNRKITKNNLPALTRDLVSDLTTADIKSLDIAFGQTVNVLANVPASFEVIEEAEDGTETTVTYDISAYKNAASVQNAIKLSIAINDENATRTGASNGSSVYAYTSGGKAVTVTEENPLVMTRFYGRALPQLCEQFPKDTTSESNGMYIDCLSGSSQGTADWYFDSETLEPIACVYTVSFLLKQDVEMKSTLLSGNFKYDMGITYTYIYLFSDYYSG